MPLEQQQAWGINHLSMKPIPMFDHPHSKEFIHNVQSETSLEQLCAIPTYSDIS